MATPRPLIGATGRPYWNALDENRIVHQRCGDCARWIFYPRVVCSGCGGGNLVWHEVSGAATLYTFTVAELAVSPDFTDEVPQLLAIAELDIGIRVPTTLVDIDPDDIQIGMALTPVFDHETFGDVTLLRFRPATSGPE